jgi:23S rRNA pseudouridine2457 synthase
MRQTVIFVSGVSEMKYYVIHKPYGVLSQFTDKEGRPTLTSLFRFPADVYPVGRLDLDSEGLLILTDDKRLTDKLLNSKNKHEREYFVQIEGIPSAGEIRKLKEGMMLNDGKTLPAKVELIGTPDIPPRIPPIRERKNIPVCWISITLIEGRNRQVRRMTAAAGHPTLRLVRVRIKNIKLGDLPQGGVRELKGIEIDSLYK